MNRTSFWRALASMRVVSRIRSLHGLFSEHTIIAWVMTAAILPMLFLAFFAYQRAETALRQSISNALLTDIKKKVNALDLNIASKKLNLIQFSALPELTSILNAATVNDRLDVLDPKKMLGFSNYLNYITPKLGVEDFFLVGMDGQLLYALHDHSLVGRVLTKNGPLSSDLYEALDGTKFLRMPYVHASFHREKGTDLSIYLSNVVVTQGPAKAALIMKLNAMDIKNRLQLNFGYTKPDHTLLGMMLHSKPTIVMNTMNKHPHELDPTMIELLRRAIAGDMELKPIELFHDNATFLAIYSYVPQLNMGLVIQYNQAQVLQGIHWLKINMIVLTLIDLLMVIMIVLWIAGSLREAHAQSERLLENILPQFVVDELKEKHQFLAREVHHISVLFIDLINFTPVFSAHSPNAVVVILDELFSMFDGLCDTYQLEKIKTIGDAYMAVSGLIAPQPDHAERAIRMGLDAIDTIKRYNATHGTDFSIRVGIDSGDVVAGIIGKKKFSYDLWGNSVNCASRMESTGLSNEVQISTNTYAALLCKEPYQFKRRKRVIVKGIGVMNTYLVARRNVVS